MTARLPSRTGAGEIKAVLGPTNTGKTHLAIERLCAHSSGAIGFPLRLLAREVYDRVRAIKGDAHVALITGEERIEPPGARWLLCTAEAMPRDGADLAFVALDEAQLSADPERGHIFTDRLLHARGREETMLLGSATLEPMIKALVPEAEIVSRPRFSTLSHAGSCKLSRVPPRSAIVAFSVEQVYAVAEMLRRHRGGAAVVMGALSPETRNRQVDMFQSGEVDYIVATDAIGMGLNLDVSHVAFASLSKFDGSRRRRLTPPEMAQIAGRAGRHQKDGTFGALSGSNGQPVAFSADEVFAIEEHKFAPLTHLMWREAEPRTDNLATLIADLEERPDDPVLAAAPEAIDLAVLRHLANEPDIAATLTSPGYVARFWDACSLPDFRQQGAQTHARFVARLWPDLRDGCIAGNFAAARIAELDNVQGDIDTLQGRIAAIRTWSYIAQRPDWVEAKDEMAARARSAEARLSDALHARLTERFVNRRTSVLMKSVGKAPHLLNVVLDETGIVTVEGEAIGHLDGFHFVVDAKASHTDRKLLLAAAERHMPQLLAQKADQLVASELGSLRIEKGRVMRGDDEVARILHGRGVTEIRLELDSAFAALAPLRQQALQETLTHWLRGKLGPLHPLYKLETASRDPASGSEVRALLLKLVEGHGVIPRHLAGLEHLPREKRKLLHRLGVTIGALDIFATALLKPAPRQLLHDLQLDPRPINPTMQPVIARKGKAPTGYRQAGKQAIRIDMAERILRNAHDSRSQAGKAPFVIDLALATSVGLTPGSANALLRDAGFVPRPPPTPLPDAAFGPPAPQLWRWKPRRIPPAQRNRHSPTARPNPASAFAALADLIG
ncbi:MAG: helicase-related protein [Caenibius sp.]